MDLRLRAEGEEVACNNPALHHFLSGALSPFTLLDQLRLAVRRAQLFMAAPAMLPAQPDDLCLESLPKCSQTEMLEAGLGTRAPI